MIHYYRSPNSKKIPASDRQHQNFPVKSQPDPSGCDIPHKPDRIGVGQDVGEATPFQEVCFL